MHNRKAKTGRVCRLGLRDDTKWPWETRLWFWSGERRKLSLGETRKVQAGIVVQNCAVNHTYGYQIRG